ncbi:MAG: carbon-nitrogen hydrolase family protein [Proteobacteria bacterium]|nr:carbon-nitrogen hydrolase family protein [Pseudomonadota bacterium]
MSGIRISAVSFRPGPVRSFNDFAEHVGSLIAPAVAAGADFVVFPELFTAELMGLMDEPDLVERFRGTARFTDDYLALFGRLSRTRGLHIVAGSHLTEAGGRYYNTGYLFHPDGRVDRQRKVHLFPLETLWTTPGDGFEVFETGRGKVAILTCYDLEFPEAARLAALQGAEILFSPSATLGEAGYWRVRHCAQARCVEDQVYTVHAGLVGEMGDPGLLMWGRASILCPCDAGLPPNGVLAEGPLNQEAVITAEVDTALLHEIREHGAATTLKDRRRDVLEALYRLDA